MTERYFCGWYFKCQAPAGSLALIPAVHAGGGSLQLITDEGSWNVPFAPEQCAVSAARPRAVLGRNVFCEKGLRLAVNQPDLRAKGQVRFGPLLPPAWDVMGPFCAVPFLQCRRGGDGAHRAGEPFLPGILPADQRRPGAAGADGGTRLL